MGEPSNAASRHSNFTQPSVLGCGPGELAIDDNQVRHELVLILEAIAEEHELTNGQADLLEVAGPPLTVQNP